MKDSETNMKRNQGRIIGHVDVPSYKMNDVKSSNKLQKLVIETTTKQMTSPFDSQNDSGLPVAAGAQNVSGPDQTTS